MVTELDNLLRLIEVNNEYKRKSVVVIKADSDSHITIFSDSHHTTVIQ